ncbi:MAG TPA: glycosyltransferase family A protein [Rhodocyclaceae bacterium]|nr:glycosyltransferase family A protein [Rhodocyclaceae bacterium]HNH34460.1 glycosyltransferase family A protein [Rhodocyclaceae bacterium]
MRISVVIPTFNRARLIRGTIPALLGQQIGPGVSYEVIFVDNGSSDETRAVLSQAAAAAPELLRYRSIAPTGGPSAPRNVGIRAADGDAVVILDDDVLPEPGLVQAYAEFHLRHPEPQQAAVGEAYVPESLLTDPMSLFHSFPYDSVRNMDRLRYFHFWTCNVSVKRAFMLEKGMFDERFLYNEDMICGHRLEQGGMELHFLPNARGQHLHQMTPAGLEAKGIFTGRWIYATCQYLPDPELKRKFGVIDPSIGWPLVIRRLVNRAGFRLFDNPLTRASLRALGATEGRRNRVSDLYYYLVFRRAVVAGYRQARREAREGIKPMIQDESSGWVNRGDV